MSQLLALKSAKTLEEVSALLGFKTSALAFILYKKDSAAKYKTFDIPKRYGGIRTICAPTSDLKLLQRRLSNLLQNCVEEINSAKGFKDQIAHGFKRRRSIVTNARCHRNKRYVFNVDLHDFFGTINFGRVRGFFASDNNFALDIKVATVLAQIACHENSLPQGSPCSPVISNLIGHILDLHLVRLAAREGCVYSRYADDLTFSTNRPEFPETIAKPLQNDRHAWTVGRELMRLVERSGFAINPSKTRMQYRDSRQEVTGLVVNSKVNVRSEYRRAVRAMVHRLFTTGQFEFVRKIVDANGSTTTQRAAGTLNQLHGMLGFVDGIDLYNKRHSPDKHDDVSRVSKKEAMYRRFLLFKDFYAAKTPVIVCEGKTDNIYLLHAIRRSAAAMPQLAEASIDGSIKLRVRIYKYSDTSTGRILGITGGTSPLARFIHTYRSEIARFSAPGNQNPVVLLIDNDSGADSIYSVVKQITKTKFTRTEPFVHVVGNLYIVPTPLLPEQKTSMIEDFFDVAVRSTVVSGKTFDPDGNEDTEAHYGKIVFAHKVVRPSADAIDFSGFNKLLSNIVLAIQDHEKKHVFPTPDQPQVTSVKEE